MKRFFLFCIAICVTISILSGCQFIDNAVGMLVAKLDSAAPVRQQATEAKTEVSQKIIDSFNKKDDEGIVNLLCKKTQEMADIREQVQSGFDFISGNIVSYEVIYEDNFSGYSKEHGKTVKYENTWIIKNITTDTGDVYEFQIHMFVLDTDKNREGVSNIYIADKSNRQCEIGYYWKIYNYDGSTLAHNVIKAIGDEDIEALKALFCAKSLDNEDIENQMLSSFTFFSGKANFGKVKDKPGIYDGNYDFHSQVEDEVVVKNDMPVRIYISVFCENIETDTNNIYRLELYAHLLYIDNRAYEGISQVIIRDGDNECVIGEKPK